MLKTDVVSSNIHSVGWEDNYLFVWFKTARVYRYAGVPVTIYNELVGAPSAGKFLNSHIKPFYKVEDVTDKLSLGESSNQ